MKIGDTVIFWRDARPLLATSAWAAVVVAADGDAVQLDVLNPKTQKKFRVTTKLVDVPSPGMATLNADKLGLEFDRSSKAELLKAGKAGRMAATPPTVPSGHGRPSRDRDKPPPAEGT